MVDAIVKLTAAAVIAVAMVNIAHALWLALRLARHAWVRFPGVGLQLWLPVFGSRQDVRDWLAAWREIVTSAEPTLVAMRAEARAIAARYVGLMIGSNGWALAVVAMLPSPA